MTRPVRLCILYGFCEGPHSGRRLLPQLRAAGFQLTSDVRSADIVLGHSGGCFLVPNNLANRPRILMVGLPYWPGRSTAHSLLEKNRVEFREYARAHHVGAWLRKFAWHQWYFWRMRHNLYMLRAQKRGDFRQLRNVVLIRNRDDYCCTPDTATLPFTNATYLSLPGQHDDLWLHPEPYIDILKLYAKQLLA